MKKQFIPIVITIFLVSAYAVYQSNSTNTATNVPSRSDVSFSKDVQPILQNRCSKCHMGEFTSKDLHMDTYESLMTGSEDGPVIAPGDAQESLLVQKILSGKMPKRGPKLTPEETQIIIDWINLGAQNN